MPRARSQNPENRRPGRRRAEDTASVAAAAPGELELVQAFVNTATPKATAEELRSPRDLARWLSRRGLTSPAAELTDDDLRRAVAAREALRSLLWANNGGELDAGAFERLDRAISGARFQLRFDRDGTVRFEPVVGGLDAALGTLLEIVASARLAGRWPRLKACADGECRGAYYDSSRSGTNKWCTRRCGARVRAREHRRNEKYRASRR
ncbi:MAG TPA: CGNR zinc finger domain-containing protein [Candidatus Tectomicrobia bacterium]